MSTSTPQRPRFDLILGVGFLLCAGIFTVEIVHYVTTGEWALHGGLGAFSRWPVAEALHLDIGVHALGMISWIAVVVHQLLTRGAGAHAWVGRVGGLLLVVALAISWRPALGSRVPTLHGAFGLTMQDLTITVTTIGIVAELLVGVYKARHGDIESHRKHLLVSVIFTATPAAYRLGVFGLTAVLGLQHPNASIWMTTWAHEMSQCVILILALVALLTPRLGAHLSVLKRPREHDAFERTAARVMLGLGVSTMLVYSLWTVDLLAMWGHEGAVSSRTDIHLFVLHFAGMD